MAPLRFLTGRVYRERLNPTAEEDSVKDVFFRTGDRVIVLQNDWSFDLS